MMSDSENAPLAPVQDQMLKTKGSPLANVDSSKRMPFSDIANKPKSTKTPLKDKQIVTPSRLEAIRQLDEEQNWRDRTEVLTKYEHTAYRLYARELIDQVIENLPGGSNEVEGTPKKREFPKDANFRDTASRMMDDSAVENMNDTINSPALDKTLDTLNVPVANSTLLNSTKSNPATPDRSDGVFENSLLSSFEKMKIKEEEEAEDDIFHDASDEFATHDDVSPEKDIVKDEAEQFLNLLDVLTNSIEKISVHDSINEATDKSETPVVSASIERQPVEEEVDLLSAGEQREKRSPLKENLFTTAVMSDDKKTPENASDGSIKGQFDDPEFNPFLTGAPAGKAVNEEKLVAKSPLLCVLSAEDAVVGSVNAEKDSGDLKTLCCDPVSLKNSIIHSPAIKVCVINEETNVPNNSSVEVIAAESNVDQVDKEVISSEKMWDVKNLEEFKFDPFTPRGTVANSPPVSFPGGAIMTDLPSAKSPVEEEKEAIPLEKNHNSENVEQLQDPCSNPVAPNERQDNAFPLKNSPMEVLNKEDLFLSLTPVDVSANKHSEENLSQAFVNEPVFGQVENEALPSKGEYNLNILDDLDDPNCNPFASRSAVANSPAQEKSLFKSSKLSENKEGSKNISAEVQSKTLKNDSTVTESSNIVTSPKRKFEEAFSDDEEDNAANEYIIISQSEVQVMPPKDDVSTDNVLEQPADSQEEDIVVPKKGYNLDFLDAVGDDPNLNPFVTKSAVTNTPEKGKWSELNKKEEMDRKAVAGTISKKDDSKENSVEIVVEDEQDLPRNNRIVDDTKVNECPVKDELNEKVLKDGVEENEAEAAAPSKGYNLDFLGNLDDPNFNPFASKASVTNSPSKISPGLKSEVKSSGSKSKAAEMKKKNSISAVSTDRKPIAENEHTSAQIDLKKNEIRAEKVAQQVKREHSDQEKVKQEDEEEIIAPSKGCQLDFLDRLDDPNFNPFETKSAVSNSPSKDLTVAVPEAQAIESKKTNSKPNAKTSVEKKKEQIPSHKVQANKEGDAVLAKNKEKKTSTPVQSKGLLTHVKSKEDCKGDSKVSEEMKTDVIPSSQKEDETDFVNKFNYHDFDPFVTRSSVLNSPERDTKEKVNSSVEKTAHEAADITPLEGKAKANNQLDDDSCKVKAQKVETQQLKVDKVKMTTTSVGKPEDEELSVPKNEYQFDILDHLDDPNFNPFATKGTIANSPNKESVEKSLLDIETEKPSAEIEQKDKSSSLASAEECQPVVGKSTSVCDAPFLSQMECDDCDSLTQEALKLVADGTPSKRKLSEMRTPKVPSLVQQNDVFGPLLDSKFEEFVNATDLSQEKIEPVEGEQFQSASSYTLFSNPEDLDVLGRHGTDGDKLNLVRNSLFVKFDPLVSGRQSLAPYLAQQKLLLSADNDPRRASGLISFSPSPDKHCRQPNMSGSGTPVRPLFKTQADETVVADTTSLNDTTICCAHNTTVVASSAASQLDTTVISHGGKFPDDSVFHHPAAFGENMIPEQLMNEKIRNMEMVMQDKLLRQSRALEDLQKTLEQQADESSIVLSSLEEENTSLRSTIQKLQAMIQKMAEQEKIRQEEKKREIVLLENKYELQCKALREESREYQEELKKMETPFYDLVKKYTRLQEVTESLRRNEETHKAEIDTLQKKLIKKEESFKNVLQTVEENSIKTQQEYQAEKEQHEHELNKLYLKLKKAELNIMSLTDTVEKTQNENRRLTALFDDMSNKFS